MIKTKPNYNLKQATPRASSRRKWWCSWGGQKIQDFKASEEEAPCLASQSAYSLPWRRVWWKLTIHSRCCSWTIWLIRGAWGWCDWTSDIIKSRVILESDSKIIFLWPPPYSIRRPWKIAYNSAAKQEVIPQNPEKPKNQSPILFLIRPPKPDLPGLERELPSTLTLMILSKGGIHLTCLMGFWVASLERCTTTLNEDNKYGQDKPNLPNHFH